jgi:hypothetical protein
MPELADDPLLLLPTDVPAAATTRGSLPPAERSSTRSCGRGRHRPRRHLRRGPIYRGFANSEGQRNWHATTAFNLQWSLYHRADKAVKTGYAGFAWDRGAFARKMSDARERLALIGRPRARSSPASTALTSRRPAMEEIASILCWGGILRPRARHQQSALARCREGEALDPRVSIVEDTAGGVSPASSRKDSPGRPGYRLIEHRQARRARSCAPRTAREFGMTRTAPNGARCPESLAMSGGTLASADALAALDTALRSATALPQLLRPARVPHHGHDALRDVLVEKGRIVAPVDVLRFDDTLYRLLGENLEDLTRETEFILDAGTYQSRQLASVRLPGRS